MMHSPLFQISPLFQKNFQTLWNFFSNFTFSVKFFKLHPPKFLTTSFSHRLQIFIFPLFLLFQYISPIFHEIVSPYFSKFHPWFHQIYMIFTCFMCFSFPPSLTMMQLCITQCTYWTPLANKANKRRLKSSNTAQTVSSSNSQVPNSSVVKGTTGRTMWVWTSNYR